MMKQYIYNGDFMKQAWTKTAIICCVFFVLFGCNQIQKTTNITDSNSPSTIAAEIRPVPDGLPVIEFEETEIDFGQVGPATTCEKELKFKNTGKGILKINEIFLCCGVMAGTDKMQYEPNETGIFKIEFQAPGAIGTFERQPKVYTNDPVNPEIAINIFCDVVQKVFWEPGKIKMLLNVENAACPKLTIKCIDEQPFAITGISSTGNCVTAEYNPTIKKTEHVLDLKVDMKKLPEQIYGEISIKMNHPEGDLAKISFDVVPKYTVSPKTLYMHRMKANIPQKQLIKIINNYKDDVEIESATSKENRVKLSESKRNGFDFELEVEMTVPQAAEDVVRFTDIFYINLSNGEQLAVTCMGYYE